MLRPRPPPPASALSTLLQAPSRGPLHKVLLVLSGALIMLCVLYTQSMLHPDILPSSHSLPSPHSSASAAARSFVSVDGVLVRRNTTLVNLSPPLTRSSLGHASWVLLHSIGSFFPTEPSLVKQGHLRAFLSALPELYPCATCARHLREHMTRNPLPDTLNRASVSFWLCGAHNAVNTRLDKPLVDCARVLDLWPGKLGADCGCEEDHPVGAGAQGALPAPAPPASAAASAPAPAPAAAAAGQATSDAPGTVVDLTPATFDAEVLQAPGLVVVEFYAPWCSHCITFAPKYKKAAELLKGAVKLTAVDVTKYGALAAKYKVRGYPSQ